MPKIAWWEKEFCYKIGLFRWEDFLEAKKATATCCSRNVLEYWNDSAAEEAFQASKNRFFATINGLPVPEESLNPADLYIDHIDWSSSTGASASASASGVDDDDDAEEEEEEVAVEEEVNIENIKPTGWDYTVEEFSAARVLTGLILSC